MKTTLEKLRKRINLATLDSVLTELSTLASTHYLVSERQQIDALRANYNYIKHYLLTGYDDDQRKTLYHDLTVEAYNLSSQLLATTLLETNRTYVHAHDAAVKANIHLDDIAATLRSYSDRLQSATRQSDSTETAETVYEQYYAYRRAVFNTLYTMPVLSSSQETTLATLLCADATSATDCRLMLCAMMLSQQLIFDIRMFRVLVAVVVGTADEVLRAQALTALVLSPPNEIERRLFRGELAEAIAQLRTVDTIGDELFELQLQLLISADTKRNQRTVRDIFNPLLRQSQQEMERASRPPTDDEKLEDILNPGRDEATMHALEDNMQRVYRLYQQGVDIFYDGFSHAKRYPFFYTLTNWFVPFSIHHPQLAGIDLGDFPPALIGRLMGRQMLCDSDLYSFYLNFAHLYRLMPEEQRRMIYNGEVTIDYDPDIDPVANARRLFLQDLYRFYHLYPSAADFTNPFAAEETLVFLTWNELAGLITDDNALQQLAKELLQRDYHTALSQLLDLQFDHKSVSYHKFRALMAEHQKDYKTASKYYEVALSRETDNIALLLRSAEVAQKARLYPQAAKQYKAYLDLIADDDTVDAAERAEVEYQYALSCLQMRKPKDVMNILYKLYYLYEENVKYRSALAFAQLLTGEIDKARNTYCSIPDAQLPLAHRVRKALILWHSHDRTAAIQLLSTTINPPHFAADQLAIVLAGEAMLCHLPLTPTDERIIADLAAQHNIS